jgi:hypothetical protein
MKKPTKKETEEKMLKDLNDFMKDFGIEEINFGKTHKIKKTNEDLAQDIIVPRKRKK